MAAMNFFFRMNKFLQAGAASALFLVLLVAIHQHGSSREESSLRLPNTRRPRGDERMLPFLGSPPSKLKMYWEPGYNWQVRAECLWKDFVSRFLSSIQLTNPCAPSFVHSCVFFLQYEDFDRKWCLGCESSCSEGNNVEIQLCDENGFDVQWGILTIFGMIPFWAQIRLEDGQNLCIEADIIEDKAYLADCDPLNEYQWFDAKNGNFGFGRFEISPRREPASCLTQSHWPKANEDVEVRSCTRARQDDTSFWIRY